MSNWTDVIWEWWQSLVGHQADYAELPQADNEAATSQATSVPPATTTPVELYSALSLSQWLSHTPKAADAADGWNAYEVEQAERSAFESFMQGYSLL